MAIKSFVRHTRSKYDVIFYDWMGTWSRSKIGDIDLTLRKNILRPGGLLIMTVSLRRGRPETLGHLDRYKRELPCTFRDMRNLNTYVDNIKVCGIPRMVQAMAADRGVSMLPELVEIYYSETGQSTIAQPQLRITMRHE
jgi:hypothetical protein